MLITHWGFSCVGGHNLPDGCVKQKGFRSHHTGQDIVVPPLQRAAELLPTSQWLAASPRPALKAVRGQWAACALLGMAAAWLNGFFSAWATTLPLSLAPILERCEARKDDLENELRAVRCVCSDAKTRSRGPPFFFAAPPRKER